MISNFPPLKKPDNYKITIYIAPGIKKAHL